MPTPPPLRGPGWFRLAAALLAAGAVLLLALPPKKTREAVAYLRGDPGSFMLTVSLTPPTGDGWNPGFELRSIILVGEGVGCIEPSLGWESGVPVGEVAMITDRQVDRMIRELAKSKFFQEAQEANPDVSGPHGEIHVSGPTPAEPAWRSMARWASTRVLGASVLPAQENQPRSFSATYPWNPRRLARRLRRLRDTLDGEAAEKLDRLIAQLPSIPR